MLREILYTVIPASGPIGARLGVGTYRNSRCIESLDARVESNHSICLTTRNPRRQSQSHNGDVKQGTAYQSLMAPVYVLYCISTR